MNELPEFKYYYDTQNSATTFGDSTHRKNQSDETHS